MYLKRKTYLGLEKGLESYHWKGREKGCAAVGNTEENKTQGGRGEFHNHHAKMGGKVSQGDNESLIKKKKRRTVINQRWTCQTKASGHQNLKWEGRQWGGWKR